METALCYFVVYILEAFILWYYCTHMFPRKYSSRRECISIILLYILPFAGSFQENVVVNLLSFTLANVLYMRFLYQARWHTGLFHGAVVTIVMFLGELLAIGFTSNMAYKFYEESYKFSNLAILTTMSKLVYFLFIVAIVLVFRKKTIKYPTYSFSTLIMAIIPISSLFIAYFMVMFSVNNSLSTKEEYFLAISALLLLAINIIIFSIYNYNQLKSLEFAKLQIQYQKERDFAEYYMLLSKQHENQSILIHDIKKHLNSISHLCQDNDMDAVQTYISQIMNSDGLKGSVQVSDNKMLNAIFSRYITMCQESNIDLRTDIRRECLDFVQETDLTALICNIMDNAYEAALGTIPAYIEVTASTNATSPLTLITLTNTCATDPFSGDNNTLTTRKADKIFHGYGLKSVRRIVEKYQGDMEQYYNPEDSTFHTIITLKP